MLILWGRSESYDYNMNPDKKPEKIRNISLNPNRIGYALVSEIY